MYRLFSIGVCLLWVTAMAALFHRDVWPAWTAQDAPPMTRAQLQTLARSDEQFGLFGGEGRRMGTAWSQIVPAALGTGTTITGNLLLDGLPLGRTVRIRSSTEFDDAGELARFVLDVYGLPLTTVHVDGERLGRDFPCKLQIGPLKREIRLDPSASRMIGESFRPFAVLPELRVGQAWRMQMLDPLSMIQGGGVNFTALVVRVVGRETISHQGETVACFRVETFPKNATAWVDHEGNVLVQEVEMAGLGKVTVRQEPFDPDALTKARQRVPARPAAAWAPRPGDE